MYNSVLELHSYIAFAVLVFLLIAALNAFMGLSAKRPFLKKDRQIALIALIFAHIQLVIGIVLFFVTPQGKGLPIAEIMHDGHLRKILVEHPVTNIIALVLITIGWSRHKRLVDDKAKFKSIGWMYLIGLILLLSMIPYDQWL